MSNEASPNRARPVDRLVKLASAAGAKDLLKHALRAAGLEVFRFRKGELGIDPLLDMQGLLADTPEPIVFDVGANEGQSVETYKTLLPRCAMHCFEPNPTPWPKLEQVAARYENVALNDFALGASADTRTFRANSHSGMSSFLEPGDDCWGEVVDEFSAKIHSLDGYCTDRGIPRVDLLKMDVQGYELEVLRGAEELMAANRLRAIFMEIIFSDMYQDLPPFDVVYRYLIDHGFKLVSMYRFSHQNGVAGWTDGLFVNPSFAP